MNQRIANRFLRRFPPTLPAQYVIAADQTTLLPDPSTFIGQLRGTPIANAIERISDSILEHKFPLLGYLIETGAEIRWRRDYVRGVETDLSYSRRESNLDHKVIWELNRHQHLQLLAQAFCLTGRRELVEEIGAELDSWHEQNPFLHGVNWTSTLEVAFRALAWIWVDHLVGRALPGGARKQLHNGLYQHGAYLEKNLPVYVSPNTHLLGEAVALHALGVLFAEWTRSAKWKQTGADIVEAEMTKQVRGDGSQVEQSSACHIYALDFFLFHALLEPVSESYRGKLSKMADYLAALTAVDGVMPLLGDDDGGSLFFPYGDRRSFGTATLATCSVFLNGAWPHGAADRTVQAAWWLGEKTFLPKLTSAAAKKQFSPHLFADAGVAVLANQAAHIVCDTRGFGHRIAGHSHAHALSLTCRYKSNDILIDPGTYTYSDPKWRNHFRGTAFHNTVRVDGVDQADPAGLFGWENKPDSQVLRWAQNARWSYLHAECAYRGVNHRRHALWIPELEVLAVADVLDSADEEQHHVEQFWHCGEEVRVGLFPGVFHFASGPMLALAPCSQSSEGRVVEGWQSEVPGEKVARPVICAAMATKLPNVFGAILFLKPPEEEPDLRMVVRGANINFLVDSFGEIIFSATEVPWFSLA